MQGHGGAVCGRQFADRPRLEVADVFRAFGEGFRKTRVLSSEQARAFDAILAFRTPALGGHLGACDECGFKRPSYNSCFNRHCPRCQGLAALRWVEGRKKAILPVAYFHVVFTLPAELRPLALRNRQAVFDLMFETVSKTLLALGEDPARLGARLGLTAVLHTWTRDLAFHPHLHCIVTGGGLSKDGWRPVRNGRYLFPIAAMGRLFQGKFLAGLKRLYRTRRFDLRGSCAELASPDVFAALLDKLYRIKWRPYAKRPFAGPEQVFNYLGYYTHRVGISGHRLLTIEATTVRFKTKGAKTAVLAGEEFIRRFLLHVLPRGFVKIRHYGLLAAKAHDMRELVRDALPVARAEPPRAESHDETGGDRQLTTPVSSLSLIELARLCPGCGRPSLVRQPLHERPPPQILAQPA